MPTYTAPGVYIEEIPSGPRPIAAVGTSSAAILGVAPDVDTYVGEAKLVKQYSQFLDLYENSEITRNLLATAVNGFFSNGGSQCYVVNLGRGATAVTERFLKKISIPEDVNLILAPGFVDEESYDALISHCELRGDRMVILDAPENFSLSSKQKMPRKTDLGLAAVYAPWIETRDALNDERTVQPPSGHIAGLYARNDMIRGVHKAPANLVVKGAVDLTRKFSRTEQQQLNKMNMNSIRKFSNGIRVWGARTLAGSSSEWRYVPVRRLAMMIMQSIEQGTRWAVFEPNDEPLWQSLQRQVTSFLDEIWRGGALAGATAREAFFVRCDRTTMTQADIDLGRVNIEIGIAPLRPAEFIIIRIGQKTSDA